MGDFKLKAEQKAYLDSLICQRISDDEENRKIIDSFKNYDNPNLPHALRKGWNKDKTDKIAYYIVKEPGGMPLLFFSLKCGEVNIPFCPEKLDKAVESSEALLNAAFGQEAPEWAVEVVEKRKVDGVLPLKKLLEFYRRHERNVMKRDSYEAEIRLEGNNILRTKKSLAGVELDCFCVHDPARDQWKAMKMNSRGIGKALFWKFIVPIVQDVRELVGCEYFYLFAADSTKKKTLIRYYEELGFEIREDLSVSKPEFDFCCFFMCQKVTALRNRQKEFFKAYNNPMEPHKVK